MTICTKRGESNHLQMGLGNPLLVYGKGFSFPHLVLVTTSGLNGGIRSTFDWPRQVLSLGSFDEGYILWFLE